MSLSSEVHWRDDIASLVFPITGHGAICAVAGRDPADPAAPDRRA
ncbi:hypothetical protein ACVWZ4_005863 [Bradyrhizobium sp. USDA 4472]